MRFRMWKWEDEEKRLGMDIEGLLEELVSLRERSEFNIPYVEIIDLLVECVGDKRVKRIVEELIKDER